VGVVKYVKVLDEAADSKDTVLNIVGVLHAEYTIKQSQLTSTLFLKDMLRRISFKQLSMNMGRI